MKLIPLHLGNLAADTRPAKFYVGTAEFVDRRECLTASSPEPGAPSSQTLPWCLVRHQHNLYRLAILSCHYSYSVSAELVRLLTLNTPDASRQNLKSEHQPNRLFGRRQERDPIAGPQGTLMHDSRSASPDWQRRCRDRRCQSGEYNLICLRSAESCT